jgi:hypothetical protein
VEARQAVEEDLFAWVRPDGKLFCAVGKTTLPDGKKYDWLIIFETPACWRGQAEEIATGLNEGKTKTRASSPNAIAGKQEKIMRRL